MWCTRCSLVQLRDMVAPDELFSTYQHISGAAQTNAWHLAEVAELLMGRQQIGAHTRVMDVGSNDGTLLSHFLSATRQVLGVDPARNLAALAREKGVDTVSVFLNPTTASSIVLEHGQFDVITALNVVAHTPAVRDLLSAIALLLAPGGTFMMEAVDALQTVLKGEFDTVYHEHYYCFSLTALLPLLSGAGLTIVDAERIPSQGGSLRVFARHTDEQPVVTRRVDELLELEAAAGVLEPETYREIGKRVVAFRTEMRTRLLEMRRRGKTMMGLGAPARGVVILNHCGVGPDLLEAVIDDTPLKQGRLVPGVHIPVTSWDVLTGGQVPEAYVLLSWNYEAELMRKLARFVQRAEVLIPFPTVRVRQLN
jgi:SAM-dependent methyltransferase